MARFAAVKGKFIELAGAERTVVAETLFQGARQLRMAEVG